MKTLAFLCVFVVASFALKLENISSTMQENIDKTLLILKNTSGDKSKAAGKIFELFDPIFDYKLMAKLSLSKHYDKLSEAEKKQFSEAFEAQLKKSFTDKLHLYKDQTLKIVKGEKNDKGTRYFLTSVMRIDGEDKFVVFKFYQNPQKDWLIYDVDVLGVSIIQTYRTQFGDVLENENFQTLLEKIKAVNFYQK
ncbi:toluene tolerance protein [Campylobacter sp. MIT 99-7217]|uniref:MlaC/ttg2D family ABC transporter substrate-binding protein n=1 Tax=Campylobacter sp. MIT 99-7217 TaxID=535091 RepID=UPI0011586CB0|nr:ABC transporter substrate-binding protein [Campylobacter sp. MIT 99-7217]TQR33807.1 toluene tolerance protein [Campylobacter sp. MIT 99-7217]